MSPRRIQLRRTAGWRKPVGAVVVARPTRWGNPHPVAVHGRAEAIRRFRADLVAGRLAVTVDDVRAELAGHDLACWCPPDGACHADVLLEFANARARGVAIPTRGQAVCSPASIAASTRFSSGASGQAQRELYAQLGL